MALGLVRLPQVALEMQMQQLQRHWPLRAAFG